MNFYCLNTPVWRTDTFTMLTIYVRFFHTPVAPSCVWKNRTSQARNINQLDLHTGVQRNFSLLPSTIGSTVEWGGGGGEKGIDGNNFTHIHTKTWAHSELFSFFRNFFGWKRIPPVKSLFEKTIENPCLNFFSDWSKAPIIYRIVKLTFFLFFNLLLE